MSQNITIMGASYSDVPAVTLPKTGGGTAQFDDTTIASNAAAASDITSGKQAWVNGSLLTGTSSGGGGNGLTLIATKDLGTISTSSTSNTDTGQTLAITGFDAYDLLVCICRTNPHTNNRHIATVRLLSFAATSTVDTKTSAVVATSTQHYKLSSNGTLSERTGTTPYGVYVNAGTISTSGTRTLTLSIYQRYNSTSTGTINGHYYLDVYGVKLQSYL